MNDVQPDANGFLCRWARREAPARAARPGDAPTEKNPPPFEPGRTTEEVLRKLALRKLFRQPEFSRLDGLNEYDGDYTYFETRGNIVTQDMRRALERIAAKTGKCESPRMQNAPCEAVESTGDEAPPASPDGSTS